MRNRIAAYLNGAVPVPAWAPLNDAALVSGLHLPGGYSTTGTPGVDGEGTWLDESGNARHALSLPTGGLTAPVADADGFPIFAGLIGLIVNASFNGDLAAGNNGAIVVIGEFTGGALDADPGIGSSYIASTMVMGSGATPHINVSAAGLRCGGYDAIDYVAAINATSNHNVPKVFAGKWDALGMYQSISGAAWSVVSNYNAPQVSLSGADMGATAYIGQGFGGSNVWNGPIKAVAFYPDAADLDNAKLAQWQAWAVTAGLV